MVVNVGEVPHSRSRPCCLSANADDKGTPLQCLPACQILAVVAAEELAERLGFVHQEHLGPAQMPVLECILINPRTTKRVVLGGAGSGSETDGWTSMRTPAWVFSIHIKSRVEVKFGVSQLSFQQLEARGKCVSVFKVSLVYILSSRPTWTAECDPISKPFYFYLCMCVLLCICTGGRCVCVSKKGKENSSDPLEWQAVVSHPVWML